MLDVAGLAVEREGTGVPVVLLHALGTDRDYWRPAVRRRVTDQPWVSVDLPGHGGSGELPPVASVEDVAGRVLDALDALDLPIVDLAGASVGGMVALCIAARQPHRVRRLVIADSTARYTEQMRTSWRQRAAAVREHGVAPLVDSLLPVWFSPDAPAKDPEVVRYVRERLAGTDASAYAAYCDALETADLRGLVGGVNASTLVLWGSDDVLAPDCAWLAEQLPDATAHFVTGGRHATVLEFAGETAAALDVHLGRRNDG